MIWVYCRLLRSFACSATNVPNWYWGWKKETRKLWSRFHKNNECKEQEYVRGYDYRGAGGREVFSWLFIVQVSTNRMKSSIWLEIFRDLLPPSTSEACYPEINWSSWVHIKVVYLLFLSERRNRTRNSLIRNFFQSFSILFYSWSGEKKISPSIAFPSSPLTSISPPLLSPHLSPLYPSCSFLNSTSQL